MADISEKQKIYILAAIFGIAGIMIYYTLLLKPQFSGFTAINKEYSVIRDRVKNGKALIANETGIRSQYGNLKKQAEYLEKRLPGQDKISSLLQDFSNVAESSGVKILSIKPLEELAPLSKQPKSANDSYAEFPILIESRAGYHQLGTFISKLETMDRFIKITDLNIIGTDSDPRHHNMKMRIITYVLK